MTAHIAPLCFDGVEEELAADIVDMHDALVVDRGFCPQMQESQMEEMLGKVASVVSSSFGSFFGMSPNERYDDLFSQIADFAEHLSKDHIFPDANKRTTVAASISIIRTAGYTLDMDDSDDPENNQLYWWIQDIVTGGKTIGELAGILRNHAIPIRVDVEKAGCVHEE